MKILHITPTHYPATIYGGPIFTVWHMNNELAKLPDVALRVLTTDAAGKRNLTAQEKCVDVNYEIAFARRIAGASIAPGLIGRLFPAVWWADVVHLTALYSFPTIPVLMACCIMGKPLVWSLHGALLDDLNRELYDPEPTSTKLLKRCWNHICRPLVERGGAVIHVTTEQELGATHIVFPKTRFVVVPNGVEIPKVLPKKRDWMPNGQIRLMFLGRLAPKKGVENLLHAMARFGPEVRLKLYGTGDKDYVRKLDALARELQLEDQAVFMGHVDGEAKTQAFFEADVCVVPSYSENFCIVVAEALAHGVPVIVSDRLSWEKVAEVGCGLVVPNNPESLAQGIRKISVMDLSEMGMRGRIWMVDEYSWEKIAESMLSIYQNLFY